MISVEEMKELLAREFGIKTEDELNTALRKRGGIRIGVFTDEPKTQKEKRLEAMA